MKKDGKERAMENTGKRYSPVLDGAKGSITKRQKTVIWTLINKHALEEAMFREWLKREFKTASTRELSAKEAGEVIQSLKVFLGLEYERCSGMTWGVSRQQIRYIWRLAAELGWNDKGRVYGMCLKMFPPKNRLELLNKTEGTKLIIALEKMAGEVRRGAANYA